MEDDDNIRMWMLIDDYYLPFEGGFLFARNGFIFDGASIPRFFRRIYDPTGYLFLASLWHDQCYKHGRYLWTPKIGGEIQWIFTNREESDDLLKRIAKVYYPAHKKKTWVAHRALRVGGWVAWNENREEDGHDQG